MAFLNFAPCDDRKAFGDVLRLGGALALAGVGFFLVAEPFPLGLTVPRDFFGVAAAFLAFGGVVVSPAFFPPKTVVLYLWMIFLPSPFELTMGEGGGGGGSVSVDRSEGRSEPWRAEGTQHRANRFARPFPHKEAA